MAIDLSVIVTTRDNLESLKNTITSLQQQTFSADRYEIVIADDSKGNETQDYISTFPKTDPLISCVSSENLGFQHGRNKAVKNSEGDLILFLNDTCLAPATLLEAHYTKHTTIKHSIVRGPLMPQHGPIIQELRSFKAPQLDFTIINASIPRLGIAQIEKFNDKCKERFQDNEMYWRLRRSKFNEHFACSCYCFQEFRFYQEHSLATVRNRAERFASSALEAYFENPQKDTAEALRLDIVLSSFQYPFTCSSLGYSIASSLINGKLEGKGWLQSSLMDAVFYYTFYERLKMKMKNFA